MGLNSDPFFFKPGFVLGPRTWVSPLLTTFTGDDAPELGADPGEALIGFILNLENLENLENRPFLQKVRENLEYSGNFL